MTETTESMESGETGNRLERRKRRTRQALIDAAVALFERQGYERTTVAEIAEAADVSTRTFFLHFPTKEDLLFANASVRLSIWDSVLADATPGERVGEVVLRAIERMVADAADTDLPSGLAALRARLIGQTPQLQVALQARYLGIAGELAEDLHRLFADQLDRVEADALVGAVLGAVGTAAVGALRRNESVAEVRDAMLRAAEVAVRGSWG